MKTQMDTLLGIERWAHMTPVLKEKFTNFPEERSDEFISVAFEKFGRLQKLRGKKFYGFPTDMEINFTVPPLPFIRSTSIVINYRLTIRDSPNCP